MTLKARLAALFAPDPESAGDPPPSLADVQAALGSAQTDALIASLDARGLMPHEPEARAAAERLAGRDPDTLRRILEAERPGPRIATTVAAVAPAAEPDPIADFAAANNCSYTEAIERMGG